MVGVSKQYISNIERAEPSSYTGVPTQPSIDVVDRLAKALKQPIQEMRDLAGYALPEESAKAEAGDGNPNTVAVMQQVLSLPSPERIKVARTIFEFEGIRIREGDTIILPEELPKEEDAVDLSSS